MTKLEKNQQYRIVNDSSILTITAVNGGIVWFTVLKNNEDVAGKTYESEFKSLIGKGQLVPVSLHKAKKDDTWVDPAGGTHHGNEEDPAAMYESRNLNEGLMDSLIGMGYGDTSRQPNEYKDGDRVIYTDWDDNQNKGTIKGRPETRDDSITYVVLLDNGKQKWGYEDQFQKLDENKKVKLKEAVIGNLYDIAQELDNKNILNGFTNIEGESDDVVRVDFDNGNQSIWLYADGSVDGNLSPAAISFLKRKGFVFNRMSENKKNEIKNKNILKETSHEIPSPKYMVNYEEQDIVKAIKEMFKNYDGTACSKIAAVGDSQFYNVEVSMDVEDEGAELEAKRFVLAQKMHKVRAELFADLSAVFPVVGINMANYKFTKNEDKVTFTLTILMSQTNQRDWVSGQYQQKDKKISDKLAKIFDKEDDSKKK